MSDPILRRVLTDREVNTLLCAMRGIYRDGVARAGSCDGSDHCEHLEAVEESGGLLSLEEADALCEELSLDMTIESSTVAEAARRPVPTCDDCGHPPRSQGHRLACVLTPEAINNAIGSPSTRRKRRRS